jgi:hypothetical protein
MLPPNCLNSDMLTILIDQFIASGGPSLCHLVGAAAARHEGAGGQ